MCVRERENGGGEKGGEGVSTGSWKDRICGLKASAGQPFPEMCEHDRCHGPVRQGSFSGTYYEFQNV